MATSIDAGSIYSDVRIRLDKLSADIKSVKTSIDGLGTDIQTMNDETADSYDAIGLAGVAAFAGITVAAKAAISTFSETEQSLANVAAVSNATAAEFKQLEDAANEAGTTTRFTAGEAADALYFLSSAGLDATQSVDALNGVLELAGATGSDLATAAQAVTSSLSQFGLEATDSARVSNVFAAAASNSQATLDKLKSSLATAGPIAGALGIDLEEVTGSLQSLYNAGLAGETAGTALKTALALLADQSSTTVSELEKLGISFDEVNPENVGLTGALEALEDAGISTAEVIAAFGTEAGPALVSLLNDGTDTIKEYTDAVTDTEEAARQYAVQNDTLAGAFDELTSATEGATNSLVGELAPILETILDLASSLLRGISSLPSIIKGLGTGAGVAAVGFISLSKALTLVGVSLGTGPLGLITIAGAAVVGLVSLSNQIKDNRDRTDELAEVTGDLVAISDEYNSVTKELEENTGDLSESEQRILEARQEILALKLEEKLAEYAAEYSKYNDQLDREKAALEALESDKQKLIEYNDKVANQEERIAEVKQQLIDLEEKVASGSATLEETIKVNQLRAALNAVIESEGERLENQKRLQSQLALSIVESEAAIKSQTAAFAETELAGESSILAFAKAYNQGTIDIGIYKDTYSDLYDEIVRVADELKASSEDQQDAPESIYKVREEFEEKWNKKLAESLATREELREAEIEAEREAAIKAAEKLGADVSAINEYYDNQRKDLADESNEERLALEQEWSDALLDLKQDEFESLESERQAALDAAKALGASTVDIEAYYEQKKTDLLDQQIVARNALRAEEYTYVSGLAGALSNLLDEAAGDNYAAAVASKALAMAQAGINSYLAFTEVLASNIPYPYNIVAAGTVLASGLASQISIATTDIPSAATGGIVLPSDGGTLVNTAENGNPELLLNSGSSGSEVMGQFADQISSRMGGSGSSSVTVNLVVDVMDFKSMATKVVKVINTGVAGQISSKRVG